MPSPPCPNCEWSHARLLEISARLALNHYRCGSCGHSWSASKDDDSVVHNITLSLRAARASLPPPGKRRAKA